MNYLGRIMQEGREPVTSAFKTYYRLLFGPGHPYGQPQTGSGTESSIKAITVTTSSIITKPITCRTTPPWWW